MAGSGGRGGSDEAATFFFGLLCFDGWPPLWGFDNPLPVATDAARVEGGMWGVMVWMRAGERGRER